MKRKLEMMQKIGKTLVGCIIFGLGFNMFLEPNGLNAGGVSGLSMVFVHLTKFSSVGVVTAVLNLPLFILAGMKVGKKFFFGSLFGMLLSSTLIDLLAFLPTPNVEPLIASVYGGAICGLGIGMVFSAGASTGGSDIIVRLLKLKWRNVPIGTINICFDFIVARLHLSFSA